MLSSADDIVLLADTGMVLQGIFNGKKSKVMIVGKGGKGLKCNIDGEELDVLEAFRYLGVRV